MCFILHSCKKLQILTLEYYVICTMGTQFTVVHVCQGKMYLNVAYKVMIQRLKVATLLSSVFHLYAIKILCFVFVSSRFCYSVHLFSFLPEVEKHLVNNATLSAETKSSHLLFAKRLANNEGSGEIHEN